MKLSKTGAWGAGTAALCVLLLVATYMLLAAPQRAAAADARAATQQAQQANARLQQRITELAAEYQTMDVREAELAAIRAALPPDPDLAAFLKALDDAAVGTGATLASVTVGAAAQATATATAGATTPTDGSSTAAGATTPAATPTASPSTAASDPAASGGTGSSVVAGDAASGAVLAAIPITADVQGDFFAVAAFVKGVQADVTRAFLVTGLTVRQDDQVELPGGGTGVTATLTGSVFVYVDPQASDAVPAAGPTSAPTVPAGAAPGTTGGTGITS